MVCKYFTQKINKDLYCKYKKEIIKLKDCSNCIYKSYKNNISKKQIKHNTPKLAKLEKNRFSLFHDGKSCIICNSDYELTWHEIYRGKNRPNSMIYGLCIRLCYYCHDKYQENKSFNDYWHKKGQIKFEEVYPDLNFVSIFHRDYL